MTESRSAIRLMHSRSLTSSTDAALSPPHTWVSWTAPTLKQTSKRFSPSAECKRSSRILAYSESAIVLETFPTNRGCKYSWRGRGGGPPRRPLPHHRTYGSVYGGSRWLRRHFLDQ